MDKGLKISVIMSVFGYEDYVESTIESILLQTVKEIEFIIIDDGCKYDLMSVVNDFNDDRIMYIKNKENIGLTASLINGVLQSEGKYIARMDAGNIALKERLEAQYDFLEKNSSISLTGSSVMLIDEGGKTICEKIAITDNVQIGETMPLYNCIDHSSILFRKDLGIGYRSKFKYSQDYDLYLNMLSAGHSLANLPETLLKERFLPYSVTYNKRCEQEYYREMAAEYYRQRQKCGKDDYGSIKEYKKEDTDSEVIPVEKSQIFFKLQKLYYLLYSGKLVSARKLALEILKSGFNTKAMAYYVISYLPLIVKMIGKRKGIR